MDVPSSAPRRWMRWFPILGVGVFALVPLYLASVGPACWLREKGWLPQSTISVIYAPLIVLEQRAPRVFRPLEAYAIWWIDRAGKPSDAGP